MDLQQLMLLHQLTQGGMQPGPTGLAKQGDAMEQMQNRSVPQVWGDEAQFRQPPESAVTHAGQVPEMQVPWHQDLKGLLSNIGGGPGGGVMKGGQQVARAVPNLGKLFQRHPPHHERIKALYPGNGSAVERVLADWKRKRGGMPQSDADWKEVSESAKVLLGAMNTKDAPSSLAQNAKYGWELLKNRFSRDFNPAHHTPNQRSLPTNLGNKAQNINDVINSTQEFGDWAGGHVADAAEFGSNMRSPGSMPNMGGPSDASPMTALAQSAPAMPQLLQQLQGLSQQQLPRQKSSPSLEEYLLSL